MNELGFNYYLYYLKENENDYFNGSFEYYFKDNKKYVLYGYTADKELSKRFEKERNMDLFKKEKVKATIDLVSELGKNFPSGMMTNFVFPVYNETKTMASEMAVTELEKMTIDSRALYIKTNFVSYCWTNISIFKKEIRDALRILDYDKYNKMIIKDGKAWNYNDVYDIDDIKINYFPIIFDIVKGTL